MNLPQSLDGKYELLAKLSEGGMGAVYKVRHTLLDEVRVVKVILPHLGHTAELSDRFLREARAASRLRHPNIAQILDFLVDEQGHELLVMEFIDGLTCKEILRRTGPPPLGLTVEIARQALAALGYLHRRGFVHRDISPDNLMLARDPDGKPLVKLIDLGIAKAVASDIADLDSSLTQTGIFLGKPRYASPEQLEENGHVDTRSDLYSFGIVLYELLTGRAPIAGRTPQELMAGHLMRPPLSFEESDPQGRVPPALRQIVLRMLEKKPQDRIATAEELSERLAPFAAPWPAGELDRILERRSEETGAWADGPAPAVAHATRRTVQPEAAPVPAAPPPPVAVPDVLPEPPARKRGWLVFIAGALVAIAIGFWLTRPHEPAPRHPKRSSPPAVQEPSPVSPQEPPMSTSEPVIGEEQTPIEEETPADTVEPAAGFVEAQPVEEPQADYPEQARGSGLTVRATADVQVDSNGRVLSASVPFLASATPIPDGLYIHFRDAALKAARRTRFQPATRDGVPVKDKVRLIVELRE